MFVCQFPSHVALYGILLAKQGRSFAIARCQLLVEGQENYL
jgi:hypothetical protein